MQKEVEADLNLRQKVATFDDYHDFTTHIPQNRISARESIGGRFVEVPYYELSLTEINLACDRHAIDFTLKTAWRPDGGYEFEAYEEASRIHAIGDTRAIAVCHLFVAVMAERSRQKERAMERDRLGRKIAEETLELASQHPDFKQAEEERDRLVKALDLRQKVATLAGWEDIYMGETQQELLGTLHLIASTANGKVPHYETNFNEISRLFTANGLTYKREIHRDNIEVPNENVLYTEKDTRLTGCGETAEIALCNLFVAVMEARGKGNQAQEDLPLREKVAILGGWSDIQNNGIGGLKGRDLETYRGSQHYSNIPPYEIDFVWIHKLCLLKDVDHKRLPLSDYADYVGENVFYVNPRTNLIGEGKDPAIALCNLFIAVMESRLAISSSFKVEANNLRTLSESLNLINSQINSSYDRVEAMLDATKEALIEEIERLKRELESLSRR